MRPKTSKSQRTWQEILKGTSYNAGQNQRRQSESAHLEAYQGTFTHHKFGRDDSEQHAAWGSDVRTSDHEAYLGIREALIHLQGLLVFLKFIPTSFHRKKKKSEKYGTHS